LNRRDLFDGALSTVRTHDCRHVSCEAVAVARHSDDVAILTSGLAERASQRRNALREVVLLDEGVRPERTHQFIFSKHPTPVAHEEKQRVEDLRR